jgi:hypothetical protein
MVTFSIDAPQRGSAEQVMQGAFGVGNHTCRAMLDLKASKLINPCCFHTKVAVDRTQHSQVPGHNGGWLSPEL